MGIFDDLGDNAVFMEQAYNHLISKIQLNANDVLILIIDSRRTNSKAFDPILNDINNIIFNDKKHCDTVVAIFNTFLKASVNFNDTNTLLHPRTTVIEGHIPYKLQNKIKILSDEINLEKANKRELTNKFLKELDK